MRTKVFQTVEYFWPSLKPLCSGLEVVFMKISSLSFDETFKNLFVCHCNQKDLIA